MPDASRCWVFGEICGRPEGLSLNVSPEDRVDSGIRVTFRDPDANVTDLAERIAEKARGRVRWVQDRDDVFLFAGQSDDDAA